ncbi:MAG: cell division protein ZapE [Pseudomonadota bacterium]
MSIVLERYHALVAAGELRPDIDQEGAAERLDRLAQELEKRARRGVFGRLFGGRSKGAAPRGVYLWGSVGRGKSMLMDLFYDQVRIESKRRAHFHEFMLEVHERLAYHRRIAAAGSPLERVAAEMSKVDVLAFDELIVTNPADATILSRLFGAMMANDVAIVATSNRPPRDLYLNGINRDQFLPFIDLIERDLDVMTLDGPTDYRLDRLGSVKTWLVPNGAQATQVLSEAFFRLTDYPVEDRAHVPSFELDVPGGRTLHVPKALKGVAVFSFKRLCGEPRGAADYLAIAHRFHTVILVGIPRLGPENRNEAARFVTLIDALYNCHVKLLAAADAEPDALYPAGDGAFEFQRTASRLHEMGSDSYLAKGHGSES